jgi:hypothetical protein
MQRSSKLTPFTIFVPFFLLLGYIYVLSCPLMPVFLQPSWDVSDPECSYRSLSTFSDCVDNA